MIIFAVCATGSDLYVPTKPFQISFYHFYSSLCNRKDMSLFNVHITLTKMITLVSTIVIRDAIEIVNYEFPKVCCKIS